MLNLLSNPILLFANLAALLVAIGVHEFSHAYVADRLGDPTPRLQGRVTLNPLAHLDPLGLIFILFVGFGWGKPVQFDPYNLKDPRKEAAIISIAGPVSNFLLAFVFSLVLRLFILSGGMLYSIGAIIIAPMIYLNIALGVFNLLPIDPLDGFKIVGGLLPKEQAAEWFSLRRYGFIFLIVLILPLFGNTSMLDMIIRPIITLLSHVLLIGIRM